MLKGFPSEAVFRKPLSFPPEDIGSNGLIRPERILYQFQELAKDHLESLGVGKEVVAEQGLLWVIVQTDLRIIRFPAPGESLTMETWNGKKAHGTFWRHSRIFDSQNNTLVRCVSMWVLMDEAGRTLNLDYSWKLDLPEAKRDGELPSSFRGIKIPSVLPYSAYLTARTEHTDENQHVNNAQYLPWAESVLTNEFRKSHRLTTLWIEYRKEVPEGRTIRADYSLNHNVFYMAGHENNTKYYSMRAEYDKI